MKLVGGTKTYKGRRVLSALDLELKEGEILCILGESGTGKTTLLNVLAGLTVLDEGEVIDVPKQISYVFQEPRLITGESVLGNLLYVGADEEKAKMLLEKVGLCGYENKKAGNLSGGEKQRVNFARAFALPFELLLLDEPFSSLDMPLKKRMKKVFFELWEETGRKTTVFVTHDLDDALSIGNRIIVLQSGKIMADEKNERESFPADISPSDSLKKKITEKLFGIEV